MDEGERSSGLEHRHLRSALEFAVAISAEGAKRRPPLRYPPALKKYLHMRRLPAAALGPVRRAIEADDEFRSRLGIGASPELIDQVGLLWLQRPAGWEERARELVAEADAQAEAIDTAAALRREQKRREAAEQAAARTRAELVELHERVTALTEQVDQLRADVVKLDELHDEARAELVDARNDARHARDRAAAATLKLARAEAERADAVARMLEAEAVRDEVLAGRAAAAIEAAGLASLAAQAQDLAERLASLTDPGSPGERRERATRRRALALPGGVAGDTDAATEYLLRSGASVVVDGYNVAKLGWPELELAVQRRLLLDAVENLARRLGSDITVVFDGAGVVGAATDQRRLARVVFSPEGVIADDVIRTEVARLPPSRHVVVVTNDAEIVRDVRAKGANTISSDRFLAQARR